jgi:HAD superfamily hydrolase (TIGR01490 family)
MKAGVNEIEEVKEVKEKNGTGAAFFDIDGTLLAKPSLERRFFWELHRRASIPTRNYLRWFAEMLRTVVRDVRAATQANKIYLRGVSTEIICAGGAPECVGLLPEFFPAAVQRVWWHASRGDSVVLVSGTLAPLAEIVKYALERELLWRGVETKISVLATQLEICQGRCTGRVAGAAMFGEEKGRAAREFARAQNISLAQCSAYGDSSLDRWMLAAVGNPFAINPTSRLRRIARLLGWPMLEWTHCSIRTAGAQRALKWRREAAR